MGIAAMIDGISFLNILLNEMRKYHGKDDGFC